MYGMDKTRDMVAMGCDTVLLFFSRSCDYVSFIASCTFWADQWLGAFWVLDFMVAFVFFCQIMRKGTEQGAGKRT